MFFVFTVPANLMCPLCQTAGNTFYNGPGSPYLECPDCKALFVPSKFLPDPETEISRYKSHNNDVEDPSYQKFVSPIVNAVERDFSAVKHTGLDFGAGTGPVITKLLKEKGFKIAAYDPFFINDRSLLQKKYDFIAACEVIEHFHHPRKEFHLLRNLLNKGGRLYCMTHIYDDSIPFENWYYKNDSTHVFIYRKETFSIIKQRYGFSDVHIYGRLITLTA